MSTHDGTKEILCQGIHDFSAIYVTSLTCGRITVERIFSGGKLVRADFLGTVINLIDDNRSQLGASTKLSRLRALCGDILATREM